MAIVLNFDEDSKIHPDDLDLEWREQSHLFGLYAKQHAEAIRNTSRTRAILDRQYREEPEGSEDGWQSEWGKFSESALKARIDAHPMVIEAEYEESIASGQVRAIDAKRQALENLVTLAKLNWFSVPQSPKDLNRKSRFEDRVESEEVKDKIHQSLNGGDKKRRK